MNDFENEELVYAFENLMVLFENDIKPYAIEICKHLKYQYFTNKLINLSKKVNFS